MFLFLFIKEFIIYLWDLIRAPKLNLSSEELKKNFYVLITGASAGLGKALALEMAMRGSKVIMGCRDLRKAQEAVDEIRKVTSEGELIIHKLDLCSLASVREFAQEIRSTYPCINLVVCNAGISNASGNIEKTLDGFEAHFGINQLGHFLLINLILDLVKIGAPSRIIFVSSSKFVFNDLKKRMQNNDLNFEKNSNLGFMNFFPYGNSKFANMLCARELSQRLIGSKVSVYSVCPGLVKGTEIYRSEARIKRFFMNIPLRIISSTPKKGCDVILYTALSNKCAQESGDMYRLNKRWRKACKIIGENEDLGRRLWETCERLTGIY